MGEYLSTGMKNKIHNSYNVRRRLFLIGVSEYNCAVTYVLCAGTESQLTCNADPEKFSTLLFIGTEIRRSPVDSPNKGSAMWRHDVFWYAPEYVIEQKRTEIYEMRFTDVTPLYWSEWNVRPMIWCELGENLFSRTILQCKAYLSFLIKLACKFRTQSILPVRGARNW